LVEGGIDPPISWRHFMFSLGDPLFTFLFPFLFSFFFLSSFPAQSNHQISKGGVDYCDNGDCDDDGDGGDFLRYFRRQKRDVVSVPDVGG